MIEVINSQAMIPFFVSKVENQQFAKEQILNGIKDMGTFGVKSKGQSLHNTDYYLPNIFPRNYLSTLTSIVDKHNAELANVLNTSELKTTNFWFQQYSTGDYHTWHVHAETLFSNVYYVDLCNDASKTTFKVLNQYIEIPVEEGMVLTFPSFVQHCSRPNQSKGMKTVIGFNTTYYNVNVSGLYDE